MTTIRPLNRSAFLVEDEALIRMMITDMLEELGYGIAAEAGDMTSALLLAQRAQFDFAILDVKLDGEMIWPVAEVLKTNGVTFLFASGYGSPSLPEAFHGCVALQKPFRIESLAMAISRATSTANRVNSPWPRAPHHL
jgi:CheY-like chemotaxis protein